MSDDYQISTPGTGVFVTDDSSIYLLPIEPIFLDCKGNNVRITERTNMKWHEPIETNNLPSGLPNFNTDSNPQNIKKRDYYFFANEDGSSDKIVTVCYLRCKEVGKYSPISRRQDVSPYTSNIISKYKLVLSEGNELADDGFKFEFKYFLAGNEREIDNEGISFTKSDFDHFTLKIKVKIIADSKSVIPKENKPFHITATVTKPIQGGGTIQEKKEMELIYSPYQGWTLTKEGELKQGRTGWLFDENGLYILEDGRRVNESIMKVNKYKEIDLKIGDKDAAEGFKKILNVIDNFSEKICLQHETKDLLKRYGPYMTEVGYQAFQINRGYKLKEEKGTVISNSSAWEQCTRYTAAYRGSTLEKGYETANDCLFGVIGTDETNIPIIVTRTGKEGAKNKLVIAGPHGDERNAQRLIMVTQKHFIQKGAPENTVIYFIPCLSPTMTFADVRGIPNELLNKNITIPELHEAVNQTMRDKIQYQTDPINPKYGVDANRDYHLIFDSSRIFLKFIDKIKIGLDVSDSNMDIVKTKILYKKKGIDANPVEIAEVEGKTLKNIRVFMIHGYVDSVSVYGPYSVSGKGNAGRDKKLAANMSEQDRMRVDEIMLNLGVIPWSYKDYENDKYLYDDTKINAGKYQGEWIVQLYNLKIWAADIELSRAYNEGIRYFGEEEDIEKFIYTPSRIGSESLPYFKKANNKFYDLLGKYI